MVLGAGERGMGVDGLISGWRRRWGKYWRWGERSRGVVGVSGLCRGQGEAEVQNLGFKRGLGFQGGFGARISCFVGGRLDEGRGWTGRNQRVSEGEGGGVGEGAASANRKDDSMKRTCLEM